MPRTKAKPEPAATGPIRPLGCLESRTRETRETRARDEKEKRRARTRETRPTPFRGDEFQDEFAQMKKIKQRQNEFRDEFGGLKMVIKTVRQR
jgi:hypothetical protein